MAENGSNTFKLNTETREKYEDWVKELEKKTKRTQQEELALHNLKKKLQDDLHAEDLANKEELQRLVLEQAKEEGDAKTQIAEKLKDKYKNIANAAVEAAAAAVSSLESQLDKTIQNYIDKQQQMSAHLVGTNANLSSITDTLNNVLSTSSLVKQEAVYNKLATLLSEGITYNVEQRAFLSTLADDIDLVFNDTNGSLSRLIRLQNADLTANRLAIEYSLQKFLNQNYETSEYIKEAYSGVSDALLESQSLMSASGASAYETMVQTWLGSYYSTGMSGGTVNSLAQAINNLGSGNIEGLGSGISNLIVMGAAKAGLDFGEMLSAGINADDVNELMVGITSYLTEMGGYESNVVKSQLSKVFGVNISDLVAAQNYASTSTKGSVSSDISTLLSEYGGLVPQVVQMSNMMENFMYSWGTNIAGSTSGYYTYEISKLIGNLGKSIGSGISVGLPFGTLTADLGSLIKLGSFGVGTLFPLLETIGELNPGLSGSSTNQLMNIFNALGGSSVAGSTVKVSNEGVSGSMYMNTGSTSSLLDSSINSLGETGISEATTGDEEEINYDELISNRVDDIHGVLQEIYTQLGDLYIKVGNQ